MPNNESRNIPPHSQGAGRCGFGPVVPPIRQKKRIHQKKTLDNEWIDGNI
jgi:hypothetical protein